MTDIMIEAGSVTTFEPNSAGTIVQNTSTVPVQYSNENDESKRWFVLKPGDTIRVDETIYMKADTSAILASWK